MESGAWWGVSWGAGVGGVYGEVDDTVVTEVWERFSEV